MTRGLHHLATDICMIEQHMSNGEAISAGDVGEAGATKVYFRSLDKLLLNPEKHRELCHRMAQLVEHLDINKALLLGSRGYLFIEVAMELDLGVVKSCKSQKLKDMTKVEYGTEYSRSKMYTLNGTIEAGDRVLIIDDLIATGGSVGGAVDMIRAFDAVPVAALVTIRLDDFEAAQTELCEKSGIELFSLFHCLDDGPLIASGNDLLMYDMVEYASQHPDDTRTVVMCHPAAESLASNVIDQDHSAYRKGYISWKHFGDTYPNITFDTNLENRDVIFVMSMHDPSIFMEQLSVIMVLPRQRIRSLRIMMSYFAPGTMDRVDVEGVVATAETVATMLSSCMPQTKTGPPILEIYDIHALQERFYFKDNVIVELKSAIPLLRQRYDESWCVVFPDDGAAKRFGPMFPNYSKIVCSKKRVGNKRFVEIKERRGRKLDREGERTYAGYIIVDDLVQTGGTLLECAKIIKAEAGILPVHAFVTHAIFPKRSYRRFMKPDCPIDTFVCTNSNPVVTDVLKRIRKFHVLNLHHPTPPLDLNDQSCVYVTSTNFDKLAAVSDGLAHYGQWRRVFGVSVPSGVEEQPVNGRTLEGAEYRRKQLCAGLPHPSLVFSLESGIFSFRGGTEWRDHTHVLPMLSSRPTTSLGTPVPLYAVEESKASGWSKTCGSIIERTERLDTGWHQVYHPAGRTRREIMTEAVITSLIVSF